MTERMVTTYTMWSLFRNCRRAAYWRYVRELAPLAPKARPLAFGTLIHKALECWHGTRDLAATLAIVDAACPDRTHDAEQRATWHLATAMLRGYAARYAAEPFEVVALERKFEGPIVNPETGAESRSFVLDGVVDGIVRFGGDHYVLETKSAAVIDASYLEKLWTDFQITIYAHYVEQALGIRVVGVLYNILGKARLQQSAGETEAEFAERHAALVAKNKSGKSSAKRRMPETDEEFQARLAEKYAEPGMFHREQLYLSRDQFDVLRAELWELTQAFLDARRRDVWYQNTSYCFQYGRPCPYFALCRANGSSAILDNFYEHREPHAELSEPADALTDASEAPAF